MDLNVVVAGESRVGFHEASALKCPELFSEEIPMNLQKAKVAYYGHCCST